LGKQKKVTDKRSAALNFLWLLSLFQDKESDSHSAALIFWFFCIKTKEQEGLIQY
jgi:hypothetical protein